MDTEVKVLTNQFLYSDTNKRYHTWNYHLQQHFGEKIFKVAIDGGFDCPNRDGTVAAAPSAPFPDPAILPRTGSIRCQSNCAKALI